MSFMDHLGALRSHLVRAALSIVIAAAAAFAAVDFVVDRILFGPKSPDFWTYRAFCWVGAQLNWPELCIQELPFELINTTMAGQFSMHIWLSVMVGLVIAFPYVVWELWRFVAPGLTPKERKSSRFFLGAVSSLFFSGAAFGYFLIVPLSVQFLSNYTVSSDIQNMIDVSSYLSMVASVTLACGLLFELPILLYFLGRMGIVSAAFLAEQRRVALVIILFVSAVITPPDVLSQLVVTLPIMVLYEVGIVVVRRVEKAKEKG
jgi:sec-independent protein translocase protein TatC